MKNLKNHIDAEIRGLNEKTLNHIDDQVRKIRLKDILPVNHKLEEHKDEFVLYKKQTEDKDFEV